MLIGELEEGYKSLCRIWDDLLLRMKGLIRFIQANQPKSQDHFPPGWKSIPVIRNVSAYGALCIALVFFVLGFISFVLPMGMGGITILSLFLDFSPITAIAAIVKTLVCSVLSLYLAAVNITEATQLYAYYKANKTCPLG